VTEKGVCYGGGVGQHDVVNSGLNNLQEQEGLKVRGKEGGKKETAHEKSPDPPIRGTAPRDENVSEGNGTDRLLPG
jgi:hypothetical protein